jgi:hypothetical protein
MFKKFVVLALGLFSIGGCAVPVSVQIASWAIDGLSLLATQKSVTDHGISIVAQRDCAIWRGVVEGEMCRGPLNTDYAFGYKFITDGKKHKSIVDSNYSFVADIATPMSNAFVPDFDKIGSPQDTEDQLAFKAHVSWEENQVMLSFEQERALAFAMKVDQDVGGLGNSLPQSYKVSQWVAPIKPSFQKKIGKKVGYFVLGSFQSINNALRLTNLYKNFKPFVVPLNLRGKKNYRVIVGPIPKSNQTAMLDKLERLGLNDTWIVKGSKEWRLLVSDFWKNIKSDSKTELSFVAL